MTNETKQAPEVIYLQSCCDDPECTCQFNEWDDVTWCKDKIHDRDVKYIRADHIEDVRGMVPVAKVKVHSTGGNAGIAWSAVPVSDFDMLPMLRNDDLLYTHPADCPRCAELEPIMRAIGNFIGREYLVAWTDKFLSDIVIQLLTERDKQLAALEAKCAELEATNRQLNREILAVGDEAEGYAMKLSATESEHDKLIQAVADHMTIRAEQHQRIAALEAENARLLKANIDCVAHYDEARAIIAQQAERIKELERETEEYDAALLATDADEIVKASPTLEVK